MVAPHKDVPEPTTRPNLEESIRRKQEQFGAVPKVRGPASSFNSTFCLFFGLFIGFMIGLLF